MHSLRPSDILFPSDLPILIISASENQFNLLLHLIFRGMIYHGMESILPLNPLLLVLGIFLAFPVQYSFMSSFIQYLLRAYEEGVELHL